MTTTTTDGTIFQFMEGTHSYKGKWIGDKSETEPYWWIKSFIDELEEYRISRQQQVVTMQWVKASEKLPPIGQQMFAKYNRGNMLVVLKDLRAGSGQYYFEICNTGPSNEIFNKEFELLEWLEEKEVTVTTDAEIERLAEKCFPDNPQVSVSTIGTIIQYHEAKRQGFVAGYKAASQSIPSKAADQGQVVKEETPRPYQSDLLDRLRSERNPIEHERIRQEMLSVSASKEETDELNLTHSITFSSVQEYRQFIRWRHLNSKSASKEQPVKETAEQILEKYTSTLTDGTKICSHSNRLRAMEEYAQLAIQEQVKLKEYAQNLCAERLDQVLKLQKQICSSTVLEGDFEKEAEGLYPYPKSPDNVIERKVVNRVRKAHVRARQMSSDFKKELNWWKKEESIKCELILELRNKVSELEKGMSSKGVQTEGWCVVTIEKLRDAGEVLAYHPEWVDADFNPEGKRIGVLNGDDLFYSAKWNNYQDCYQEDTANMPTHFCQIPKIN